MVNPLNYYSEGIGSYDTGTLEWEGRQLSAAVVGGTRYEYSYNTEGLRTKAIYRDVQSNEIFSIFNYFWNNGKMTGYCVTEEDGTITAVLKNFFDKTGEQIGYEMYLPDNNEYLRYFFEKNLQGDIIGVYNEEGQKVLTYCYDAWGNVSTIMNKENNSILAQSLIAIMYTPITYRGYIYDPYTGLYYLQSRYYNPTYGRFLNADTTEILEATQGTPFGANLFTYCNNDPVNMVDYGGTLGLVATIVLVLIIIVIFHYIIDDDDPYTKSFLETIRDSKISKVLNKYPVLSSLFDFGSSLSDILSTYKECKEVFVLYYAHAKNIVDYGTGINNDPYYPKYTEVCGDGMLYKERCGAAYTMATDIGLINRGVLWHNLTFEQQYVFVKGMMFYDYSMWRDLTFFSTKKMCVWGTEELAGFYFGFMDILNK